jgi:hypothetical protein
MAVRRSILMDFCLLVATPALARVGAQALPDEAVKGFVPVVIPFEDEGGQHGNNERTSVETMRRGATMMLEIARRVVVN